MAYRKRSRSVGGRVRSRRFIRRARRGYYKRRYRGAQEVQRFGKFAHFPNYRVTKSLANLSTELKTIRRAHAAYRLQLAGSTGTPEWGLTNGRIPTSAPGVYDCLNGLIQGDDWDMRDGRQIAMKSIHIKGEIWNSSSSHANTRDQDSIFIALVLDRQCNGAPAASELIFANLINGPTGNATPTCMQNVQTKKRFKVLASRVLKHAPLVWPTPGGATRDYQGTHVPFEFLVDLKGLKVNYRVPDTPLAAGIVDNCLNLYAWSQYDSTASPEQAIDLSFLSQIRFVG